eukprot:176220-Chlamydomonas_euryale.AAC.2
MHAGEGRIRGKGKGKVESAAPCCLQPSSVVTRAAVVPCLLKESMQARRAAPPHSAIHQPLASPTSVPPLSLTQPSVTSPPSHPSHASPTTPPLPSNVLLPAHAHPPVTTPHTLPMLSRAHSRCHAHSPASLLALQLSPPPRHHPHRNTTHTCVSSSHSLNCCCRNTSTSRVRSCATPWQARSDAVGPSSPSLAPPAPSISRSSSLVRFSLSPLCAAHMSAAITEPPPPATRRAAASCCASNACCRFSRCRSTWQERHSTRAAVSHRSRRKTAGNKGAYLRPIRCLGLPFLVGKEPGEEWGRKAEAWGRGGSTGRSGSCSDAQ